MLNSLTSFFAADNQQRRRNAAIALGATSALAAAYFIFSYRPHFQNIDTGASAPPWWLSAVDSRREATRAVVDIDAFDRNVAKAVAAVVNNGKRKLRIATKSVRSVDLLCRFINAVPKGELNGLMCFTATEILALSRNARLLEAASLNNNDKSPLHLLLAYPIVDDKSAKQLVQAVVPRQVAVAVMVDAPQQVDALAGADPERCLEIWIDIDMGWRALSLDCMFVGPRRSPLDAIEKISALVAHILSKGYRVDGVMGYEGQIAGLPDTVEHSPLPYCLRRLVKSLTCNAIAQRRLGIVKHVESLLVNSNNNTNNKNKSSHLVVNGGGTGSIEFTLQDPAVTEITVGSAALCGSQFDGYVSALSVFEPSLHFVLRATRAPRPGRIVTCHGGGWVASGDPGLFRLPKIVWPPGASFLSMEGAGEVQTPIEFASPAASVPLGGLVVMRPCKSGELAEHFDTYICVSRREKNECTFITEVKTYRGEGINAWS